jgi:hypothetical protein
VRAIPNVLKRAPAGAPAAPPAPTPPSASEERAERIRFSLPLLLLAAASLVISFVLYSEAFGGDATRVPLWVLALSVGLIASVGGTASLVVGDFSGEDWRTEAESSEEFVVVDRPRWLEIQAALARSGETAVLGRPLSRSLPEDPEAPEWAESDAPSRLPDGGPAPPMGPLGPPAPMAVTHGIDSLATEVERMVADLEAAAAEVALPSPPPSSRPARTEDVAPPLSPPAVPAPQPPRRSTAPEPAVPRPSASSTASRAVGTRASKPAEPTAPKPAKAPLPPLPTSPRATGAAMAAEYRTLLTELERRAAGAVGEPSRAGAGAHGASATDRCVGCDARLGAADRTNVCRSCHAPMCPACRDRSSNEGFPGLCALCSILEESARRDGPGPR